MPEYSDFRQATPYWVALSTPDLEASMAFYSIIFGWRFDQTLSDQNGVDVYALANIETGNPAAVSEQSDQDIESGVRPSWGVYVRVDDIVDVVLRVEDLGGAIIQSLTKIGEYGISAVVSDPTGGTLVFWEAFISGPTVLREHGAMQWCELMSTDPESAAAFYRSLLDVTTNAMEMPDGSYNYIINTQDGPVFSISALSGLSDDLIVRAGGTMWVTYFNVDDVDAAVDRAVKHGAELPDPPWDVPGIGRMAWIYDPQGALLGLITPPKA